MYCRKSCTLSGRRGLLGHNKLSPTCYPGCSPAGFIHKGMGGAMQIHQVQKTPPSKPNNPPPANFVAPSIHNLTLPDKAAGNQVLLYLFTKWQIVGSHLYMRFPKGWGKNKYTYGSLQNASVEEETAPKPQN